MRGSGLNEIARRARAETIRELWHQGLSLKEIGRMIGIASSTVTYYCYSVLRLPRRPQDAVHAAQCTWTHEEDQKLTELWGTALRAKAIGDMLKKTKSAIIGRAHRLALPPRKKSGGPGKGAPRRRGTPRLRKPPTLKPTVITPKIDNPGPSISLMDLKEEHCRFITHYDEAGVARYCGGPKPYVLIQQGAPLYIGPYCASHAAICYLPPKPRLR